MAFETFDLGRVIATAEGIKDMRRQSVTDNLRQKYLQTQIEGQAQANQFAANQDARLAAAEGRQVTQFTEEQRLRNLQMLTVAATDVAQNPSSIATWLPQLKSAGVISQDWDPAQHSPEEIKQLATEMATRGNAIQQAFLKANPRMAEIAASHANELEQIRARLTGQQQVAGQEHGYRMGEIAARGEQDRQTQREKPTDARDFRDAQSLRKEFEGMDPVKVYKTAVPQYQRALNAPNTRAGDLSIVYALGKIFDPTSVVRGEELKLSKDAQPWLSKIVNEAQSQVKRTGSLDPKTRAEITAAMKGQIDSLKQGYDYERNRYAGYAKQRGFSESDVVGEEFGGQEPPAASGGAQYNYVPGQGLVPVK